VRKLGFHRYFFSMLLAMLVFFTWRPAIADFEEDFDDKTWQEVAVQLPAAPRQESLLPIYVSAATDNEFFIDSSTLTVDADRVVRYVVVVQAPGGARNVSFEGIRCETRERRIYASGHLDGSWSKSRNNEWRRILDVAANRYHAALYNDYFCPEGVIVRNVEEARDALRRGRHPESRR
jgi:hypothetical protein